jgi:hypothetical protein
VVGVVCFQGGFQGESCVVMIQLPLHVLVLDFSEWSRFLMVLSIGGSDSIFFSRVRVGADDVPGTPPLEL